MKKSKELLLLQRDKIAVGMRARYALAEREGRSLTEDENRQDAADTQESGSTTHRACQSAVRTRLQRVVAERDRRNQQRGRTDAPAPRREIARGPVR